MISHAYLFSGARGTGKTTIARLLAKAVNCEDKKSYEPCNKCSSCLEVLNGRSIDLIEIDAASHRGIDEIRELREGIKFVPTKSKYKVFIIDECHQLSKDASNALLKTLEEPPAHVIFILATTEIHKMISTIISRCQRFDFRKLKIPEIIKKLEKIAKKEGINIEKSALELIAMNSEGSLRDSESLLNQVLTFSGILKKGEIIKTDQIKDLLGIVDINTISELVELISLKKTKQAIDFLNKNLDKGLDPKEFTNSLIGYLRQLLILKISPDIENSLLMATSKEQQKKFKEQVNNFKEGELNIAIKTFLGASEKMRYSPIPQLPLELAIIELCEKE